MNYAEKILNLIFPPVCGFCNDINENFLCSKCIRKFGGIKISNIDDYSTQPVFFKEHFYIFKYENEIRDLILDYKFNEKSYLYMTFARFISKDKVFKEQFINKYDCIISVPIHKKRFKTRGYNQSALISKEIAKICEKNYYDDILVKSINVVAQSSLDKLERVKNIKGAFTIGKNASLISGKKVAIFDDIFTTGATSNECAKVLYGAGADYVGIFSLAKD